MGSRLTLHTTGSRIPHTTHFNFFFSAPLVILSCPYYTTLPALSVLLYSPLLFSPRTLPSFSSPPSYFYFLLISYPPFTHLLRAALQLFLYTSANFTEAQLGYHTDSYTAISHVHRSSAEPGTTRTFAFLPPRGIKLSPSPTTDSSVHFSQGPSSSSPPVVPSEREHLAFSLRTPSPHPEISPPHAARSRSWSQSSSNLTASSPIVPTGGLILQRRGSSQYFTPVGSLRSWGSLQSPPLPGTSSQISAGSPAVTPQAPPVRGGVEAGYPGTAVSVLPGLFSPTEEHQAPGNSSSQRRYTEDWVLREYQQHRRSDSSWYTDGSDESEEEDIFIGTHRRNPSNAKTVTPADFQSEKFIAAPEVELSSDAETGLSGGAETWQTAPQSLIEALTESPPVMPSLPSRWATSPTTPTSMESISGKSNGFRVEPEHPNSDLSVFGAGENRLDANMTRTPSSSTDATTTPQTNGFAASLLLPLDQPISISRSNTPNIRSVKKCKGKNIIIQIPSDTPWGLPSEQGGKPMPLTKKEVEERTKRWEALGYTVDFLSEHGRQSKEVFLDLAVEKVKLSEMVISIPDRKDWEAYCTELREKKLRALGVILSEEAPATTTPAATRGQTPQSHHQSPAPFHVNTFSPPQPTASAMSNPMGSQNGSGNGNYHMHHYSPSLAQASLHGSVPHIPAPIGPPANHHIPFHMPRQSMSMSTTPVGNHDWDQYSSMYTSPPQSQPTPPMMNGPGVWSPAPFTLRNGSPMAGMGHHSQHNHSPSMFTQPYFIDENMDYGPPNEYVENQRYYSHHPHHSLMTMDRYHQQQIRRGSPLAQVGHPEEVEEQNLMNVMNIDAPVPKHPHHLSISLQEGMEGMENYQKEIETHVGNGHRQVNGAGFNTNPVSPAPDVMYPQHPDVPNTERDVHNGPELRSNPDEDVSDVETERRQNQQAARERAQSIVGIGAQYHDDKTASMSMPEAQIPTHSYLPQQHYQPHSRDTSLSHMQLQYDSADPRDNSAMSMLIAGSGLGAGPRLSGRGLDELLSEDGRTNISDIVTNPSEPPSPRPRYNPSHMHNMSNNSNAWMSDTSKPAGSVTSSTTKFNAKAKEFKFNPTASFTYSPTSKPFIPPGPVESSPASSTGTHSRDTSGGPITFGFGGLGSSKFNIAAPPFRPSLPGPAFSVFAKGGAAAFSPDAPEFRPKSAVVSPPPLKNTSPTGLPPIFAQTEEAVLPPPEKKLSPIVRPPGHPTSQSETSVDEAGDAREGSVSEGGRKRVKHGPTLSAVRDTEVPALESLRPAEAGSVSAADSDHDTPDEGTIVEGSQTSDEVDEVLKELLGESEPLVVIEEGEVKVESDYEPYEFKNLEEATGFAMADSGMSPLPRRDIRLNILDKELSVEEAQIIADAPSTPLGSRPERDVTPAPHEEPVQSTLQPSGVDFNFEFLQPANPVSPIPTKVGGIESRYAHTPSPPPAYPAPSPPPMMGNVPEFEPPADSSPFSADADPYKNSPFDEPIARPMPTDSELDEVVRLLDVADPIYENQDNEEYSGSESSDHEVQEDEETQEEAEIVPWKRDIPKRPAIPLFPELTPTLENPFEQAERSAGPSPSPGRGFYSHRPSSFSTDGAYGQAQTTSEVPYQPPAQEDGIANVDSDWDDMLEGEEGTKLRPQSRLFFDTHVEEFVGGLLRSRLDPINKSLSAIHDVLKCYSISLGGRRGSISTSAVHSDADDEDDEDHTNLPRSPRDKKADKIKSAVVEALASHAWSAATEDKLAEIYGAIAKVSRAFQDSHLNDDLAETKDSILNALVKTVQTGELDLVKADLLAAIKSTAKANDMDELRSGFISSVSKLAQVQDIASIRENMEDIFKDVAQTGDIVNMKLELREALTRSAQKIDTDELKKSIEGVLSMVAHKEDLEHFQNIAIDVFSKVTKTNDLVEIKSIILEILKSIHSVDVKNDVQKLSHDNAAFRQTLSEVLKATRDNAENVDFHQESQEGIIKENHTAVRESLGTIQASVMEVTKLIQQRETGEDALQSLQKGDQKNLAGIVTAVLEVKKTIDDVVGRVPGVEDVKLVVEGVASKQPRLSDVRSVMTEVVETLPKIGDLRSMISQLLSQHQTVEISRASEHINHEELQLRVAGLEKMLDETGRRAGSEAQARRESYERALELESRLRISEEESARYREMAEESDRRLKAIDDKRHQTLTQTQMRSALLEGAHSSLQKSVGDLSARNASLEGSLREVQQASERHREEAIKVEDENKELRRVIESMKAEMEESIRVREGFRGKFDKLQEAVNTAEYNIGHEQGKWRKIHEEQKARIEVLEAKVGAEATVKEGLESEVKRLEIEQKEAIKLRVEFEQMERLNTKLEERLNKFREEAIEHSQRAAALTIEVESARGSALNEVARVKESLQMDVEAANAKANAVRAALEKDIEQARDEKEKFDILLLEAADSKRAALSELEETKAALARQFTENNSTLLQDQHSKYERQLLELRQQVEDTRSQHDRALRIATEDGEREQYFLTERLNLAQTESKQLREYISHLKEQVQVATTAAHAAAQAAQSAKLAIAPNTHVSDERALRESVDVLQTQLQQREARIEELEQELSKFDKADIKRKDEQITWLRELLEVRIDELEEIVHSLGLPQFDRESVRDAALRLRTNLQMEQREKEMAMSVPQITPAASLASRLPGVANSATSWWSSKNKGPSSTTQSSTPSRPASAAGFLGGILPPSILPPSTTLASAQRIGSRLARGISLDAASHSSQNTITSRHRDKQVAVTHSSRGDNNASSGMGAVPPQLFRRGSYDADADDSVLSGGFCEGEDDATETGGDDSDIAPFRQSIHRHSGVLN